MILDLNQDFRTDISKSIDDLFGSKGAQSLSWRSLQVVWFGFKWNAGLQACKERTVMTEFDSILRDSDFKEASAHRHNCLEAWSINYRFMYVWPIIYSLSQSCGAVKYFSVIHLDGQLEKTSFSIAWNPMPRVKNYFISIRPQRIFKLISMAPNSLLFPCKEGVLRY